MILRKIINKFRYLRKKTSNIFKSIYIFISADYYKIHNPTISKFCTEELWQPESFLVSLFNKNVNAIKDYQTIKSGKFKVFNKIIEQKEALIWNVDFFSGKIYPKIPYLLIKAENDKGSDIIVPWEFSRLQFIPTFIQAYSIASDESVFEYFRKILNDWISKNQYKNGVNWVCSMDVGIRAINLSLGVSYFYSKYNKKEKELYNKVLWAHALYILGKESFQSNPIQKHNHYLISTVSLLILVLCFYGESTKEYLNLILKDLREEIIHQFNEDGCNFEAANHYHQLSLEAVLLSINFLKLFNQNLKLESVNKFLSDKSISGRVTRALKFVNEYMYVYKSSPQFGDSSDGRIILYKDYFDWDARDHSFLNDLNYTSEIDFEVNNKKVFSYYPSGYGMFSNSHYGLIVGAGKLNNIVSGHNHCDKGSFVLQKNSIPLIVDSGTFCYTSNLKMRNKFRQTDSHNSIMIDGKEQAFYEYGAFSHLSKIKYELIATTDKFEYLQDGYSDLSDINSIKREFVCNESILEIIDTIVGKGKHLIEITFNLAPNIQYSLNDHLMTFSNNNNQISSLNIESNCNILVKDNFYSPSYMTSLDSKKIVISQLAELPIKIKNVFDFSLDSNS